MKTIVSPKKVESENPEIISHSPVKLIDEVISRAFSERASDIHIEPGESECRVRIRIDGSLRVIGVYKKAIHDEAVARLKVLSSLRTDVRMSPQDGRFKVNINSISINVRLSIVPSFLGEKCVLRLLPQSNHKNTLESLGFNAGDRTKINGAISASHGMVLVVGPTGSGKTTTMYALLQKISSANISISTLEDPIEYSVPHITQIPVTGNGHMTFATALRSVVRQDPDVIMVGEIRDRETAELSVHAALTGHILFSTLHTNDAVTALPRLADMGIEPFLIASTVRAVISQRLLRRVCQKCVYRENITPSEIEFSVNAGVSKDEIDKIRKTVRARGCASCRNTGYAGRIVASEVLNMSDKIRHLIMQRSNSAELRKIAIEEGMTTLLEDGVRKAISGVTTFEEVASNCHV